MDDKQQLKIYLIGIFLFLAGIIFMLSNSFVDPAISDMFQKKLVQKKASGSEDIVLVVIDDASLNRERWPWRRDNYADMFDMLENVSKAKVILFDAVVTSPDPYTQVHDKIFYDYLKKSENVIIGFDFCKADRENSCMAIQKNQYPEIDKKIDVKIEDKRDFKPDDTSYLGIMYMQPDFMKSVKSLGTVIVMDRELEHIKDDKTIRTYSNITYYNNKYYPSLALAGYSKVTGEKDFVLTKNELASKNGKLRIKFPSAAQKSQSNYTYLKWYKPYENSEYYTHKAYSAIDVLDLARSIKQGKGSSIKSDSGEIITPELFKDKIVFVGGNAAAQSLEDRLGSPILSKHAGVDIQATALNNYIDNDYATKADLKLNIAISIIIMAISFLIILFLPAIFSVILNFGLISIYFIIYLTCLNNDYILNFITVLLMEILLFAFSYIYKFVLEGVKKDKIQKAMGKYLSVDVMQRVVKNIDNIGLGGKKVQATIMFIDIRKFTTISENMDADEVSVLLNEYFTTIYPLITKYNGVLNKFIGDAVLAIFDDEKNHAKNAILCADEVLKLVKKLQQKWLSEGKPKIDVGVGINSGEVFLGNIGTQERMEYTVIGDTVNTASRIEGYNKIYKTKFLIGEHTYELVKNMVDVIKINQVTIRGKSQKVNIYEVLRIRK